ncbi:MAG: lipoyl synthase [Pseudomonadota bacterium]
MTTETPLQFHPPANRERMPAWIRQSLQAQAPYAHTARTVADQRLHTVCEEARCPNRAECWGRGTATFMLLGDTCTRACGFCAVKTGRPGTLDTEEPRRVAEAVAQMGLDYVVLTSVNRDELPDGGAGIFAETLRLLRAQHPAIGLEILTPDFRQCQAEALATIAAVGAQTTDARRPWLVWGHNIETVPRLYATARRGSKYARSLALLEQAAQLPGVEAKSAIMLGLGETQDEVLETLRDLRSNGVARIAIGQYLRPSRQHLPVVAYLHPETFDFYAQEAYKLGFSWVKSGPLVRSSYHAEE